MAETPREPESARPVEPDDVYVPVEGDDEEMPRRAASAEFVVDASVGSEVLMREAMDPANQSLRDALRLSYRVLQVVILVLIVLFIFSGFKTVEAQQSGVLLRWGKILTVNGSQALDKGLQFSWWPYPAGEFVLFDETDRRVNLGTHFWPRLRPGQSLEDAVNAASTNNFLRPGADGSVLTRGGDIAHIQVQAEYEIDEPVSFVKALENTATRAGGFDADRLVELSLKRATVHVAAGLDLESFVDLSEQGKADIRSSAQTFLDDLGSGIRIVGVSTPIDPTPVLSIKQVYGRLQEAQGNASNMIELARQDSRSTLVGVAGDRYLELVDLINRYEDALALGSEAESAELIAAINARLESDQVSGDVAKIVQRARSYRNDIELTLGAEARRLDSLLPAYREHPRQVVSRLWSEVYAGVLSREDAEIFRVPGDIGAMKISLSGLDHIRELRRKNTLRAKELEAWMEGEDLENPFIRGVGDMQLSGPGRQLNRAGGSLAEDE
jgi:regulator of protease activity HflC (stomatin/prohibitin superfamily)